MATTVSISVTKNSEGSYNIASGDANAKAWIVIAAAADAIATIVLAVLALAAIVTGPYLVALMLGWFN